MHFRHIQFNNFFSQLFHSRCISTTNCRLAAAGFRQPFSHQRRLNFGKESPPSKTAKSLHRYHQLPPIPFEPSSTAKGKNADFDNKALDVFKQRQKSQGPSVLYYKVPVMIVEGRGQYLFDEKGSRYLDMFGFDGLVHVGHCHPLVRDAVEQQAVKLTHVSHHFLSEELRDFTKALLVLFPSHLNSVFVVNSESEAAELAALLCRLYTKNSDLLSLRGSYFGFTHLANSLSGLVMHKFPTGQASNVVHLGVPDLFRNSMPAHKTIEFYVKDVVSHIRAACPGQIAGCYIEIVQGLAGSLLVSSAFLKHLCSFVRVKGGLVIVNEGETGLGRLGESMWGFQSASIDPDIVLITKGLANGLPMAAVVTRQEIAAALQSRLHINQYSGNPICCAAATAVIKAIKEDNLQANVSYLWSYLRGQLRHLQNKHSDLIGDVRCLGLNAALEFVKNAITKEPATELTAHLHEAMKNRGVLLGRSGHHGNILRITPPLCIIEEDIQYMIGQFDDSLNQIKKNLQSKAELQQTIQSATPQERRLDCNNNSHVRSVEKEDSSTECSDDFSTSESDEGESDDGANDGFDDNEEVTDDNEEEDDVCDGVNLEGSEGKVQHNNKNSHRLKINKDDDSNSARRKLKRRLLTTDEN